MTTLFPGNLHGAGAGIFRQNFADIMTADILATFLVRSSAAIILPVKDKRVLIFHT